MLNVDKQNFEAQIKKLETQVIWYKQEIGLIQQKNKEYTHIVENLKELLAEKDNESVREKDHLVMEFIKKTKQDMDWLINQMKQTQNQVTELKQITIEISESIKNNPIETSSFNQHHQYGNHDSITFRDLQKANYVHMGKKHQKLQGSTINRFQNVYKGNDTMEKEIINNETEGVYNQDQVEGNNEPMEKQKKKGGFTWPFFK